MRAIARPQMPNLPAPNGPIVAIEVATPGDVPNALDVSNVKWPSTPSSGGVFDTGWIDVSGATTKPVAELGVAISAGGTGPSSNDTCGPFNPPATPYDVVILIEQVTVMGLGI
jgi:hypothetical protein